jgi:predicted enzyme related to lactoylglutathione lyase
MLSAKAQKFENFGATGYIANARRFGSRVSDYPQHLTIEDTIDNMGRTMLGLSIACARCHNHKFDPISTRDYYALYGIFASTRYPFPGIELFQSQKDFVPLIPEMEAAEATKEFQATTDELTAELERLLARCDQRALENAAKAGQVSLAEQRKMAAELDEMLNRINPVGDADLDTLVDFARTQGLPYREEKDHDIVRIVRLEDPTGVPLAFYAEAKKHERLLQAYHRQRGPGIMRIDHFNLLASDVSKIRDFMVKAMGSRVTEMIQLDNGRIGGCWFTINNKGYDMACTEDHSGAKGRFHHITYAADHRDDILRAVTGSGLGILRADQNVSGAFAKLPPQVRAKAREKRSIRSRPSATR